MAILSFEKINFLNSQKVELIFRYNKFYYRRIYDFGVSFDWSNPLVQNILINLGLSIIFTEAQNVDCDQVVIRTANLNNDQINFWRDFMINIAGQKFFLEKRKFSKLPKKIITSGPRFSKKRFSVKDKLILGLGGGKESLTTEAIFLKSGLDFDEIMVGNSNFFKKRNKKIKHFTKLGKKVFEVLSAVQKDDIFYSRTPMAVPIVFRLILISLLFCYKYGYKYVVMATERSSNYGNVLWDSIMVNHQYDKSSVFLKKVNNYIHNYITPSVDYFSSFEGLYEYKIAQIFSKFPEYLEYLISCNLATIKKPWCLNCPKCAFTYLLLCAFFDKEKINQVVSTDLFDRLDLFKPLMVPGEIKPFECVGTKEETWLALSRCYKKGYQGKVLDYFIKSIYPKIKKKLVELEKKYNKIYSHHVPNIIWKKMARFLK